MGRNTQGVRLITLDEGEKLAGLERIDERDDDGERQRQRRTTASGDAERRRSPTPDNAAPAGETSAALVH